MSHTYGLTANLPTQPLCALTFLAVSTHQPVNVAPGAKIHLHRPCDAITYLQQAPDPWEAYRATLYLIPNRDHPFYNQDENGAEPYIYQTYNDFFLMREHNAKAVRESFGLCVEDPILCLSGQSNYLGLGVMFEDFEARMARFTKAMERLVKSTDEAFQKAVVTF